MWTQVKSWLNTEVRFSTGMKYHNGLSSFRLSCERTVRTLLKIQEFQTQKFLQNCYCLDLLKACEIFLILTQLYLILLLKRIFIWYLLFWLTCIRKITNLFCLNYMHELLQWRAQITWLCGTEFFLNHPTYPCQQIFVECYNFI